jgi:hypothetical protein
MFFDAYAYSPKIINNPKLDPFNDEIAGNMFSQFGVSSSALFLAVRGKPFYWDVVVAFLYSMLEELFIFLDIYRQHWWKTWMTFVGLLIFFTISKWMYAHLVRGVGRRFYYVYIILGMFPICTVCLLWGVLDLFGYMRTTTTLYSDPHISRYGIWAIFFTFSYPLLVWGYFQKNRIWRITTLALVAIIIFIGYQCHLFIFWEGTFVPISLLMIFWMYFSIWFLNKLYGGQRRSKAGT